MNSSPLWNDAQYVIEILSGASNDKV